MSLIDINKDARSIEYDKFYTEYDLKSVADGNDLCVCMYCANNLTNKCPNSCCTTGIKCIYFIMKLNQINRR